MASPPRVQFTASDGVVIVGDYYAPAAMSLRGLLLLHMMPQTRRSWRVFAMRMASAGWHVLAIDLRGHGESQGGPDGYTSFSDAEHQASQYDVEAGAAWLAEKGAERLFLGGASIGANLALQYLKGHPEARAVFLLSPGMDYRGIVTEPAVRSLRSGQAVYYLASRDDAPSADAVEQLFEATPDEVEREIALYETAGHGTTIFEKEPSASDAVVAWLCELP